MLTVEFYLSILSNPGVFACILRHRKRARRMIENRTWVNILCFLLIRCYYVQLSEQYRFTLCVCRIRWPSAACKRTLLRRRWISKFVALIPCALREYTAGSLSLVIHQHYHPIQVFYLTEYITKS